MTKLIPYDLTMRTMLYYGDVRLAHVCRFVYTVGEDIYFEGPYLTGNSSIGHYPRELFNAAARGSSRLTLAIGSGVILPLFARGYD